MLSIIAMTGEIGNESVAQLTVGMSELVYSIKCPKCSAKAVAHMHPTGKTGSYREVFIKMGVKRVVCEACGLFREVPPDESDDYELWYATDFRGHRLWARNRSHLGLSHFLDIG